MTENVRHLDPEVGVEATDADLIEQQLSAQDDEDDDVTPEVPPVTGAMEQADPADVLEQATPVGPDEEYPREADEDEY